MLPTQNVETPVIKNKSFLQIAARKASTCGGEMMARGQSNRIEKAIVCSLVLLTSIASLKANPDSKWPKFSWDTVPVFIQVADSGRTFTEKELRFMAETSDFVCIEKAHGMKAHGSSEKSTAIDAKRLKELNKDIKILFYWNGPLVYNFYDSIKSIKNRDDFFLRDKSGKAIGKGGVGKGAPQYNLLNPEVHRWWGEQAGKAVTELHCDGIFMDAVSQVQNRISKQLGGGKRMQVKLAEGVVGMMEEAKRAMGPNSLLIYNGIDSKKAGDTTGEGFLPYGDGVMVEKFTAQAGKSKEAIAKDIHEIGVVARKGKLVIVKGWPEDTSFNWLNKNKMKLPRAKLERDAKDQITFSLACFLIAAEKGCYFCYGWGWRASTGGLVDYPEYKKPLGPPKGPYTKKGWVFTRSFEHADVWVDVAKRKAKIKWK